jgi:serine/threonine protein kinase
LHSVCFQRLYWFRYRNGTKLLDFGLAKQRTGLAPDDVIVDPPTAEGQITGTLHYMAPEQLPVIGFECRVWLARRLPAGAMRD